MLKKLLALLPVAALVAGLRLQSAGADQGCVANATARATLVYQGSSQYQTCYRTTCSSYSPVWTKYITRMSTTVPPYLIVDAEYKIEGGSMTGIPACRPEISDNAGWTQ